MQPTSPPAGPPGQPPPPPGSSGPGGLQPSNGLGLAAMIVGIIAIPLACCFGVGFLPGVVAVVLGFLGRQKADRGEATNRGQAMAGIICGAVAVVLAVLWLVFVVFLNAVDPIYWET